MSAVAEKVEISEVFDFGPAADGSGVILTIKGENYIIPKDMAERMGRALLQCAADCKGEVQ